MPSNTPPIIGAIAGAIPNSICTVAITRWACAPSNKSRTMARATTLPAPPEIPCKARKNHKVSILGAKAQPIDASTNTPNPHLIVVMRPIESEIAPCHKVMSAYGNK